MRAIQSGFMGALILAALALFLAGDSDAAWPGSGRAAGGSVTPNYIAATLNSTSGTASGVGCASLAACIADTRSTTATYRTSAGVLATAAANTPRVDCTYASCGVLSEPASSNFAPYSTFGAGWGYANSAGYTGGCGATATSPDGTCDYLTLDDTNTTTGFHGAYEYSATVGSFNTVAFSVTMQANQYNYGFILVADGSTTLIGSSVVVNLTTGAITATFANTGVTTPTCTTVAFQQGAWKINCVTTFTASNTRVQIVLGPSPTATPSWGSNGFASYAGTISDGISVFGVSAEINGYVSSYIPNATSGSSARSADALAFSGALATAMAAGPSYVDSINLATGATARTLYAAGAFSFQAGYVYPQFCAYNSSVTGSYESSHSTYGTSC
jgi:hypothetical protein